MPLPKTIFVKEEKDDGESYLVADYDIYSLAEAQITTIGEYELKAIKKAKLVAEIRTSQTIKRGN